MPLPNLRVNDSFVRTRCLHQSKFCPLLLEHYRALVLCLVSQADNLEVKEVFDRINATMKALS